MVDGSPKVIDFGLADREWAANTDLSKAPGYVKSRAAKPAEWAPPGSLGEVRMDVRIEGSNVVLVVRDNEEDPALTMTPDTARELASQLLKAADTAGGRH
jgi:hypothetical protein